MAQVQWTIKGRLMARSLFDEVTKAFGDANGDVPLEGVLVQISAEEFSWDPTGFQEWGQAVTKADGSFQITNTKDKSQRFFRVRVKFKDDNLLKIYPDDPGLLDGLFNQSSGTIALETALGAVSTLAFDVDWINVWQDADKKGPGVVDLGKIIFCDAGGQESDGRTQRRHADLWFLARKVMSQLDSLGTGLGFVEPGSIGIKYPHSSPYVTDDLEQSYADMTNRVVFLIKNSQLDGFEIQTVMHELMHLRNYQHSTGELGLAWQLALHTSTHEGRQDVSWTAFHEAAAETWKTELYRQLFGQGATIYVKGPDAERRPFTRPYLKSLGMRQLEDLKFYEYGWISTFNLLLCRKVEELDINGAGPFAHEKESSGVLAIANRTVQFSFADLLKAFDPLPNHPKVIDVSEMTITKFFERLGEVNTNFDADMQGAYKKILDPQETGQPSDLLPRLMLTKSISL